jgi:surface antigen
MRFWFRNATTSIIVGLLTGCSSLDTQQENLSYTQQAANVCDETVPTNRFVDGIPAYAQCATTTGAIYSNNGVDTATTSGGSDWIRTQYSGGYQCTELAHRYLYFHWNVSWLPNGNAGTWCDTTPPGTSGVVQTTTPVHGDLIVFAPGSCGADATTGHVALVDVVNSTNVTIVEQNSAGRRNAAITCAKCFLHVSANTGPGGSGGASGTGGGTSVAGSAATGGLSNSTGGAANSGGATSPSGGANHTGGAPPAMGGSSAPPANATGGATDLGNPIAGAPATGGTDATSSGTSGTSTDSTEPSTGSPGKDAEEGSCSCRVPRRDSRPPALASFGLLGLLVMRARRRQRGA